MKHKLFMCFVVFIVVEYKFKTTRRHYYVLLLRLVFRFNQHFCFVFLIIITIFFLLKLIIFLLQIIFCEQWVCLHRLLLRYLLTNSKQNGYNRCKFICLF